MEVIDAHPKDLTTIIQLRYDAFLQKAPAFYNATEVHNLLDDYNETEILNMIDDRRLFLYRKDEEILGTSAWEDESVRHIYVKPEAMGQGIGRRLLIYAETDYKKRTQKSHIFAGVIIYARRFYEKNNYRVVRKEKAWDDSEYYLMRKNF